MQNELHEIHPKLRSALEFAAEAHDKQYITGTDVPYIEHIYNVVRAAKVMLDDTNLNKIDALLIAALHDTVEDTPVTLAEIREKFGDFVAGGVSALTKDESLPKILQMPDSLNRVLLHSPEARVIKMADRCDNFAKPHHYWDENKLFDYLKEGIMIYQMLAGVSEKADMMLREKIRNYVSFMRSDIFREKATELVKNWGF